MHRVRAGAAAAVLVLLWGCLAGSPAGPAAPASATDAPSPTSEPAARPDPLPSGVYSPTPDPTERCPVDVYLNAVPLCVMPPDGKRVRYQIVGQAVDYNRCHGTNPHRILRIFNEQAIAADSHYGDVLVEADETFRATFPTYVSHRLHFYAGITPDKAHMLSADNGTIVCEGGACTRGYTELIPHNDAFPSPPAGLPDCE